MSSATTSVPGDRPRRRLSPAGALRLRRPSEIWFKPALSSVAAAAPPNLTLLALGRLDLAMYTMAGSLCALYAHNRPYAARARALAWVVLGMLGGLAAALVTASLTRDPVVLVAAGALLAAAQKVLCDATRIGPPGNVVPTFISSASLFVPQTAAQVPGHLALAAAAGGWAWLVGMAPGLVRPHGPERRATAHALRAAAAYADTRGTGEGHTGVRDAGYAAVRTAWQALLSLPPAGRRATARRALERLLVRAEAALAAPADADPERLRCWARGLRGTGRIPGTAESGSAESGSAESGSAESGTETGPEIRADERPGAESGPATGHPPWWRLGPIAPIAVRTALGCALAGYASLALGVGRPYWALVTAAALYQAGLALTWNRTVQRVVGNLAGVLLFAAVAPLAHLHRALLVLCCLALTFGAEALITRNYWLGTVCVTPMALLITEFAGCLRPGELIAERVVDTLVGALAGFLVAVAVTDRRAADRVEQALTAAHRARERTARLLAEPAPAPRALAAARRRLVAAPAELRATADAAGGEWPRCSLPQERVALAEQAGHRTLAASVRRRQPRPHRDTDPTTEDVRP
ncbi:FUSC family protein [Streptomyces poriticola]|uniref:FUSC family protein n=1 Tax=Streptomyces poriticola TaxID=3120506 RepID=UPI002FCE62DE